MDFKRINVIFLAVLFACGLTGCEKIFHGHVEIKEAILYSPKGEFEFTFWNGNKQPSAYDGEFAIELSLFPHTHSFIDDGGTITVISNNKDTTVTTKPSFYQYNQSINKTLAVKRADYSTRLIHKDFLKEYPIPKSNGSIAYYKQKIVVLSPPQITLYSSAGASLHLAKPENSSYQITKKHIKKIENEWYRYNIQFTIDDRPYTIDVTFRLGINNSYRIAIPGVP